MGTPRSFDIAVPASWEVKLGEYPEGLYWSLANEFSKDAGLDLAPLAGRTVQAWRCGLAGGLPGEGEQSQYSYPSEVVLLLDGGQVAGAWLQFNYGTVGPSVKKRSIEDITGLSFEEFVDRGGCFSEAGDNADLAEMDPPQVLGPMPASRRERCSTP